MKITELLKEKQQSMRKNKPVTIAFLGDSVTQGCFECFMELNGDINTIHDYKSAYSTRVREILNLLKQGRLSAGEITEHFDITAAAISRHLSVLKEADLIWDTRDGKYIFYELNTSVLEEIMLWITQLKGE